MGRRLTGAVLHALLLPGLALSIAAPIATLRGPGILLMTLATVVLFTLLNLECGQRPAYVQFWGSHASKNLGFTPLLFDDVLAPRDKLSVVRRSGYSLAWLALGLFWLSLAVNDLFFGSAPPTT